MSFNPILTRVLVYDPNPLLADSICSGLEQCGPFTAKACSRGLMEGNADATDILIVLAVAAALTAVFAPLTMRLYRRG